MKWFLLLMGIIFTLEGLVFILFSNVVKNLSTKLVSIKDFKPLGILAIVIGILFFLASNSSKISLLIVLLGIISLLKGSFFIFSPYDKVKFFINWWVSLAEDYYKILGAVAFILGLLLLVTLR